MIKKLIPEERKSQIIQVAVSLFKEKGYENTSINDIIEAAGISKGGFYHHYASKEELLESIAQQFLERVLAIVHIVADREDLSALEKTNEFMRQVNAQKKDRTAEVAAFLHNLYSEGKNVRLEGLVWNYAQEQLAPMIREIIMQGIEEGEFETEFPEEAAEIFVKLLLIHQREMGKIFTEALSEGNREKLQTIKKKYMFFQRVSENIFGLKEGSLVFFEEIAGDTIATIWDHYDERKKIDASNSDA